MSTVFTCAQFLTGPVLNRDIFDEEGNWEERLRQLAKEKDDEGMRKAYVQSVIRFQKEFASQKPGVASQGMKHLSTANGDHAFRYRGLSNPVSAFMSDAITQVKTADLLLHQFRGPRQVQSLDQRSEKCFERCFLRDVVCKQMDKNLAVLADPIAMLQAAKTSLEKDTGGCARQPVLISTSADSQSLLMELIQLVQNVELDLHGVSMRMCFVYLALWISLALEGVASTPKTLNEEVNKISQAFNNNALNKRLINGDLGRKVGATMHLFLYCPFSALMRQSPGNKQLSSCGRVQLYASLVRGLPPVLKACNGHLQRVPFDILEGREVDDCIYKAVLACIKEINAAGENGRSQLTDFYAPGLRIASSPSSSEETDNDLLETNLRASFSCAAKVSRTSHRVAITPSPSVGSSASRHRQSTSPSCKESRKELTPASHNHSSPLSPSPPPSNQGIEDDLLCTEGADKNRRLDEDEDEDQWNRQWDSHNSRSYRKEPGDMEDPNGNDESRDDESYGFFGGVDKGAEEDQEIDGVNDDGVGVNQYVVKSPDRNNSPANPEDYIVADNARYDDPKTGKGKKRKGTRVDSASGAVRRSRRRVVETSDSDDGTDTSSSTLKVPRSKQPQSLGKRSNKRKTVDVGKDSAPKRRKTGQEHSSASKFTPYLRARSKNSESILTEYLLGMQSTIDLDDVKGWFDPVDEREIMPSKPKIREIFVIPDSDDEEAASLSRGRETGLKDVDVAPPGAKEKKYLIVQTQAYTAWGELAKVGVRVMNVYDANTYDIIKDYVERCYTEDKKPRWLNPGLMKKHWSDGGSIYYTISLNDYKTTKREDLFKILKQDKVIVIKGGKDLIREIACMEPGFGIDQLASMGNMEIKRQMHDLSARDPKDGKASLRLATLYELYRFATDNKTGPVVDAPEIACDESVMRGPLPRIQELAHDYRAWVTTTGNPFLTSRRSKGQSDWNTAATEGASSGWHFGTDGLATWFIVNGEDIGAYNETGGKLWVSYRDHVDDTLGNPHCMAGYKPDESHNMQGHWEAVILMPGDLVIQGPFSRHFSIGLSNTVVVGGHFICLATIIRTLHGFLHCMLHGKAIANIPRSSTIHSLQRLIYCVTRHWHTGIDTINSGLDITKWDDVRAVLSLMHVHHTQIILNDKLSGIDTSNEEERVRVKQEWKYTMLISAYLRKTLEHKLHLEREVKKDVWEVVEWGQFIIKDVANQFAALVAYAKIRVKDSCETDKDRWESLAAKAYNHLELFSKPLLQAYEQRLKEYERNADIVHFTLWEEGSYRVRRKACGPKAKSKPHNSHAQDLLL